MEAGFVVDNVRGGKLQSRWVEGDAVKSFWTGSIKTSGAKQRRVVTYRCTKCGFLESYATDVIV